MVTGALLLGAGVARAQNEAPATPVAPAPAGTPNTECGPCVPDQNPPATCGPCVPNQYTYVAPKKTGWVWFRPAQIGLTGGAGVSDFTGGDYRAATEVGATWDARVLFGARSFFAFEAGYIGTYNKLQGTSEVSGNAAPYISANGFDTDFRLNIVPWYLEPYTFLGVGYNHMSLKNRSEDPTAAAEFRDSDNQVMMPVGAGLAGYLGKHATLDARFTYRKIWDQGLLQGHEGAVADQWMVAGRLGWVF
jgi:hypothetical protein